VKTTIPRKSSLLYLDSNFYIKELKHSLSSFATSTKGDLLDLDHTNRVHKDHHMHITNPTKPQLHLLGSPLLIIPDPHALLGPMHLSIIPSQPTSHFNLTINHNISGIPHLRGGGPNSTTFQFYFLHHLPNCNSCTLLHLGNAKCLPNLVQTQIIGKLNKHMMERHHT